MTCCADCEYARYDGIKDLVDHKPWVCALTGEPIDFYGKCEHFEEEQIFEDEV